MDVFSLFRPVSVILIDSHGESCTRIGVVHPTSRPCVIFLACVHLALFFALSLSQILNATLLFPHGVTIV